MNSEAIVKFLLVDDIEENLLAIEGLLRRDGLQLLTARSGREALELLLKHDVALALLDVQMPEMNGFELAELMRNSVRTKHVPIIFLTAAGPDDQRRFRGYQAGAVDFIYKPIEPAILQGKALVFYDLYRQRQEVVRQRDELSASAAENARLYEEILRLNESLEMRVQERTAQLLETTEQLRGFTSSIAHDFRQHIRNININAQMALADGDASPEIYRKSLDRIHEVADLMNKMTDDLLTYARVRSQTLNRVDIDVTALAIEIAESYSKVYPRTRFEVAEGLQVCGDRTMFRIVLENLLENAFKYSQNVAQPLVEVGADCGGLFVRDNGIGIDMAYADKVFEPFERLASAGHFAGSGMGLANVKRILDRHEGRISVDSRPGLGATFRVSLSP